MRHLYRFNPETCTFERQSVQPAAVIRQAAAAVGLGLLLSLLYIAWCVLNQSHWEENLHARRNAELTQQVLHLDSSFAALQSSLAVVHQNDNSFYRSILDLDKIDDAVWQGGVGGTERSAALTPVLSNLKARAEVLQYQYGLQMASFATLEKAALDKVDKLVHMPVVKPVPGRQVGGFGHRRDPFHGHWQMHSGIDFDADMGTAVRATGNGTIITAGRNGESGYGIQVEVDHGYGYVTKYAHLSRVAVKEGQQVRRGDIIAYSGNTGYSTGPHLHYEVIFRGTKVNPSDYFLAVY